MPADVSNGDFVAIYKSDGRRVVQNGLSYAVASGRRPEHTSSASSHCSSGLGGVPDASSPAGTTGPGYSPCPVERLPIDIIAVSQKKELLHGLSPACRVILALVMFLDVHAFGLIESPCRLFRLLVTAPFPPSCASWVTPGVTHLCVIATLEAQALGRSPPVDQLCSGRKIVSVSIQVTGAGMPLPLAELPLDTVWCLLFLILLEPRARSGLDDTHASVAGAHGTPCPDPLFSDEASTFPADDGPSTTSDGLGGEPDYDLDTPLYDPFDRPEGEVVVQVLSPSRSRSPRRA